MLIGLKKFHLYIARWSAEVQFECVMDKINILFLYLCAELWITSFLRFTLRP